MANSEVALRATAPFNGAATSREIVSPRSCGRRAFSRPRDRRGKNSGDGMGRLIGIGLGLRGGDYRGPVVLIAA